MQISSVIQLLLEAPIRRSSCTVHFHPLPSPLQLAIVFVTFMSFPATPPLLHPARHPLFLSHFTEKIIGVISFVKNFGVKPRKYLRHSFSFGTIYCCTSRLRYRWCGDSKNYKNYMYCRIKVQYSPQKFLYYHTSI